MRNRAKGATPLRRRVPREVALRWPGARFFRQLGAVVSVRFFLE